MTDHSDQRPQLTRKLDDQVRILTQPRTVREMVEVVSVVHGAHRVRKRIPHTVTLPPLLDELRKAASAPTSGGVDNGGQNPGGWFESTPTIDLEPIALLDTIRTRTAHWCRLLGVPSSLPDLVSAPADDQQLPLLVEEVADWVTRGLVIVGHQSGPRVLADPCPYCWTRNALVISGDMTEARCTRCRVAWTPDTIGLLGQMLQANADRETMPEVACWMSDCTSRGPHEVHRDVRGRTWRREDRCVDENGQPVDELRHA